MKTRKTIHKTNPKTRTKTKAPCEVCSTRKIQGTNAIYKLKSGDTHLRQYLPATNSLTKSTGNERQQALTLTPAALQVKVILEGLKPETTIFFFASNSPKPDFTSKITPFKEAYGHLENSGVAKVDNKGKVSFKINCPRVYLAEDGEIYSRHIHWIYWNEKTQFWDKDIYTHQIFCNVDKAFVKKYAGKSNSKVIIIDALNKESYLE